MVTLIVLNVAGLSNDLLNSGCCPNLQAYAEQNIQRTVKPVLPAVTQSMQATYITGKAPSDHGIVGNGFYDRAYNEHRFWNASAGLLDQPPCWVSHEGKEVKTAALFWWTCLGGGLHTYLNVAPFHLSSGETVSSCYSTPSRFYSDILEKELGPFPLHRFWGPGVSIESSEWIMKAAMITVSERKPDILYVYLPHMDYSLQRSGPGSKEANKHLKELDDLLQDMLQKAGGDDFNLIILSEYGITPVNGSVSLNRTLKDSGHFHVRVCNGREYPDLAGSSAFAICDHQAAHIYIKESSKTKNVSEIISGVAGVDRILDAVGKKEEGLDHARSGDLVALSAEDKWFDYAWWDDEKLAPDYAFTVDIHRKIGYDPLELIFDKAKRRIASDRSLIRGSHGLIPTSEEAMPIIIFPQPFDNQMVKDRSIISALEVKDLIFKCLDRGAKSL